MHGNSGVTVGNSLEQAVTTAWFLEDAACVEERVRAIGLDPERGLLDSEGDATLQVCSGVVVERMWCHLAGDDA